MDWLALTGLRKEAALRSAEQLLAGDREADLPDLTEGMLPPALRRWLMAQLAGDIPLPQQALAAFLSPPPLGEELGSELLWRCWRLNQAAPPPTGVGARERVGCLLDELASLGRAVRRDRGDWAHARWEEYPEKDVSTALFWTDWCSGNFWRDTAHWETLVLPSLLLGLNTVCDARRVPEDARSRARRLLREFGSLMFIGDPAGSMRHWQDVAARVITSSGDSGPLSALAGLAGQEGMAVVAGCVSRSGSWRRTVDVLYQDIPDREGRARALARWLGEAPQRMESFVDAHVLVRLVDVWRGGGFSTPDAHYRLIQRYRDKATARLRAILVQRHPQALLPALMALEGLHARTAWALRMHAWAWAWQELRLDFPMSERPVTPRCDAVAADLASLQAAERSMLRTWTMLVILRDRTPALRVWVTSGSAGRGDAKFARLLSESLPDRLRDPGARALRHGGYIRVRIALRETLEELEDELAPSVALLASLPADKRLASRFRVALASVWDDEVPPPRSGYPSMRKAAQVWLAARSAPAP